MTEDEAKTKWCPFAKPVMIDTRNVFVRSFNVKRTSGSINMDLINDKCIGSVCMAWRATTESGVDGKTGYCGLAGKP